MAYLAIVVDHSLRRHPEGQFWFWGGSMLPKIILDEKNWQKKYFGAQRSASKLVVGALTTQRDI